MASTCSNRGSCSNKSKEAFAAAQARAFAIYVGPCIKAAPESSDKNASNTSSDATVAQLEAAGAIPIGKANVPEWAGAHTFNPVFGHTLNPWNRNMSAGGSSGGSAVALATGMVFLATGNDLGGSLRVPASFNGVVGINHFVHGDRIGPIHILTNQRCA
jgi:hypothetical protein